MAIKRFLVILFCFATICEVNSQVFQPGVFQPQTADYSILQRSFEQREKRQRNASQEYYNLCQLLAECSQLVHNDTETLQWLADLKKKTMDRVKNLIDIGDPDRAYQVAVSLQGEIVNDPEVIARIQTNAEYKELCEHIRSSNDMTQGEKNEWFKNHPYKFKPIFGSDGKVIGGKLDIEY